MWCVGVKLVLDNLQNNENLAAIKAFIMTANVYLELWVRKKEKPINLFSLYSLNSVDGYFAVIILADWWGLINSFVHPPISNLF